MAYAGTSRSWEMDDSPVPRASRRRTPPGRSERHRAADASAPTAAERHLADLHDAFLDAIERGSASLRSGRDDEASRELRALSNVRLNMDELLSLLAKLRAAERHPTTSKAALLTKINLARQELVTTIRMESCNVSFEQELLRKVLAFADMGDSDDSEPEAAAEASMGYSAYHAPPAAAAPPPVPPPASLRPIRVARPEAPPRGCSFTPAAPAQCDGEASPERVSPTSVLPPPRPAGLPSVYTYFDKNSGTLVTATVPAPTPAKVLVMPLGGDSEEDDWDAPDRSFIAIPPPPPPAVQQVQHAPPQTQPAPPAAAAVVPPHAESAVLVRPRAPKPAPRKQRRGGVGGVLKALLTTAMGVGVTVYGKEHIVAGVQAAKAMVEARMEEHRKRAADAHAAQLHAAEAAAAQQRAADAAEAAQARAAVRAPVAAVPTRPVVTEWQPRPASRFASAPPPSETPDAWQAAPARMREVRWQPHVSLGRG